MAAKRRLFPEKRKNPAAGENSFCRLANIRLKFCEKQ